MSETSLYGYVVHVDSAVRKECSEGIFVIKYVIYGSVNHLTIFVTCCTHLFEHFHDAINDRLAPFFTELQAMFWTLVILLQEDPLDIEQGIDQNHAENGGYPPTQNGDIRSLFWLFSLMALQN